MKINIYFDNINQRNKIKKIKPMEAIKHNASRGLGTIMSHMITYEP